MLLSIPVKPSVKHLIIQHYGKEPIAVRANSDIGQIFMLSIAGQVSLGVTFGFTTAPDVNKDVQAKIMGMFDDTEEHDVLIEADEGMEVLQFEVGGKFKKGLILPNMLEQLGKSLDSYMRIYMKGFSHGYRSMFNSSRHSAVVFHSLFGFTEEVMSRDNAEKIVQRESSEMNDPIDRAGIPRRSFRASSR